MIRFEYSATMLTERDASSGFLAAQPDRFGSQAAGPAAEMILPYGLWCRPRDPDLSDGGKLKVGCGLLYGTSGSEEFAMPLADPRYVVSLQDPTKGGTILYGTVLDGGHKDVVTVWLKPEGSLSARCPYNQGSSMHTFDMTVGAAGTIRLVHGEGLLIEVNKDHVELGGTGGNGVVYDDGSLTTFFNALATKNGIAAPATFKSSKVRTT